MLNYSPVKGFPPHNFEDEPLRKFCFPLCQVKRVLIVYPDFSRVINSLLSDSPSFAFPSSLSSISSDRRIQHRNGIQSFQTGQAGPLFCVSKNEAKRGIEACVLCKRSRHCRTCRILLFQDEERCQIRKRICCFRIIQFPG